MGFKGDYIVTSTYVTGIQVNYYHICLRKLWLFSHNIQMEHNSQAVSMGKVIHDTFYRRKRKEIRIEGIKIDFFDAKNAMIHEVKKSRAMSDSHIWQMRYYLYFLKGLGVNVSGMINYPLLRKRERVELNSQDIVYLDKVLLDIQSIVSRSNIPEVINKKLCKRCSYYDLCYV